MRIDEGIESHVREAFSAAIARDGDRITAALQGLDESQSQQAIGLGLYVCGFVVNDVYREGATDEDLRKLAQQIVKAETDWVALDTEQIAAFLKAASKADTTLAGVARDDLPGLVFISGGHLLSAFRLKEQRWHEYLDEIWAALEAAPEAPTD